MRAAHAAQIKSSKKKLGDTSTLTRGRFFIRRNDGSSENLTVKGPYEGTDGFRLLRKSSAEIMSQALGFDKKYGKESSLNFEKKALNYKTNLNSRHASSLGTLNREPSIGIKTPQYEEANPYETAADVQGERTLSPSRVSFERRSKSFKTEEAILGASGEYRGIISAQSSSYSSDPRPSKNRFFKRRSVKKSPYQSSTRASLLHS